MQEMLETWVRSWVGKIPPEKEMATHCNILARKIPWTEEPGGLGYSPWGHKESDITQLWVMSDWVHKSQVFMSIYWTLITNLSFI